MTSWTPLDLPSLAGRSVVVTGANSGIGRHTAGWLARAGASVTLACRDLPKAEDVATDLRRRGWDARAARLDLSRLASVEEFAAGWRGPLDVLVNNAGVMAPPRYGETADGFELQLGVNHLGHVALTARLLPALLSASAPRVVTVSSLAHHGGGARVLAGSPRETYRPHRSYSDSKLANLLFAFELQRHAVRHGSSLVSAAAHPGVCATNLFTSEQGLGSLPGMRRVAPPVLRAVFPSAEAGARPTLYAVAEGGPGSYTGPQWLRESRGPVGPARTSTLARDEHLAARLWDRSLEQVGLDLAWG